MQFRSILLAGVTAILVLGALSVPAWRPAHAATGNAGIKVGLLKCDVASGWGFIFGSSRDLKCLYSPLSGSTERYVGKIERFGVDIGYSKNGVMLWTVLAPSRDIGSGALAGTYVGAMAEVTAVVGAGANVLVGGSNKSISLEPISISGQMGLNVAGGIGAVTLHTPND